MPEPISIASGVSALVTNGIKLCLGISAAIDNLKSAPKHVRVIATDLRSLYSILGTIQTYLDDEDLTKGLYNTSKSACDNLQQILSNVVDILRTFETVINGYIKLGQASRLAGWNRTQWLWKEKEVERLRNHLSDHKMTLNIAIAMANWA